MSGPAWPAGVPEAAKKHTPEGGIAFLQYFYDRAFEGMTIPDPHALDGFGVSGCQSCKAMQDATSYLASNGQRYKSAPGTVSDFKAGAVIEEGREMFAFVLHQLAVDVLDKGGAVVRTEPDIVGNFTAALVWKGGRWYVYDVGSRD